MALPLLAVSWELWSRIWRHENLLVCEPETGFHFTLLNFAFLLTARPESLPAPASARLELEAGVASSQLAEPNNCHQGLLLVGGGLGPRGAGGGAWGARSWCWGGALPPVPAMLTHVGRLPHNPHIPSLIA